VTPDASLSPPTALLPPPIDEPARRPHPWLAAEFLVLFFGVPTLMQQRLIPLPILGTLAILALGCALWLLLDRSFDRASFWRAGAMTRTVTRNILGNLIILGGMLAALVAFAAPHLLLNFPRERPGIWALVMIFYPVFSVYPQELIYRAFLFHRYKPLFTTPFAMICASAAAFGYMHIIFENVIAVALTLVGGILFARTYWRTRSLAAAWLDHALWGCFVFTVGLGIYFYHGAVGR
jgi:uncharacterized protein